MFPIFRSRASALQIPAYFERELIRLEFSKLYHCSLRFFRLSNDCKWEIALEDKETDVCPVNIWYETLYVNLCAENIAR